MVLVAGEVTAPTLRQEHVDHIVNGDNPDHHLRGPVEDRDRHEIEVRQLSCHLVEVVVDVDLGGVGTLHRRDQTRRVRPDEGDWRHLANGKSTGIDDEDQLQALMRRARGADGVEGVCHVRGLGQHDEVGAHDATGGVGVVAEEVADLLTLRCRQQLEHGHAPLLVNGRDEVGRLVGCHAAHEASGFDIGSRVDELCLVLNVELFEDISLELSVGANGFDDLLAFFVGRCFDEVGDLGGVEFRQLAVGNPKASGGDVAHEWLDGLPVHERLRVDVARESSWEQAPEQRATSSIDADHFPRAIHLGEFDLVGGDQASTHQVDEVASHQVLGQEQLARTALELSEIDPFSSEDDAVRAQLRNLGDLHEELSAPNPNDEPGDGRVCRGADSNDDVNDPADSPTITVDERRSHEAGNVSEF